MLLLLLCCCCCFDVTRKAACPCCFLVSSLFRTIWSLERISFHIPRNLLYWQESVKALGTGNLQRSSKIRVTREDETRGLKSFVWLMPLSPRVWLEYSPACRLPLLFSVFNMQRKYYGHEFLSPSNHFLFEQDSSCK